jgi:hypothetical protein
MARIRRHDSQLALRVEGFARRLRSPAPPARSRAVPAGHAAPSAGPRWRGRGRAWRRRRRASRAGWSHAVRPGRGRRRSRGRGHRSRSSASVCSPARWWSGMEEMPRQGFCGSTRRSASTGVAVRREIEAAGDADPHEQVVALQPRSLGQLREARPEPRSASPRGRAPGSSPRPTMP